jgi:hypothetical protein
MVLVKSSTVKIIVLSFTRSLVAKISTLILIIVLTSDKKKKKIVSFKTANTSTLAI